MAMEYSIQSCTSNQKAMKELLCDLLSLWTHFEHTLETIASVSTLLVVVLGVGYTLDTVMGHGGLVDLTRQR